MRAIYLLAALVVPCTFAAAVNAAPAFYPGLSIVNSFPGCSRKEQDQIEGRRL
jgi:hypothetical protein